MSVSENRRHEKSRLKGCGDAMRRWLLTMPLSAGGHDRGAQYIHDFALLVARIGCPPNSLVLEIGGGSGWAAEWLARMGFRVVSLDINHEMLLLGRQRLEAVRRAWPETVLWAVQVTGDGERLPFRDGVFAAAFSLNALHHIPDMGVALQEISRVLRPDGRFVLVEPGEGHADTPESRREMEELGVLEQEVVIRDMWRLARKAGFADCRVAPSLPLEENLSMTEWAALLWPWWLQPVNWRRWRQRLVEWNRRHPAMVMSKSKPCRQAKGRPLAGTILEMNVPASVVAGGLFRVEARVRNTGTEPWACWGTFLQGNPLNQGEGGHVALGFKLRGPQGGFADTDYGRGQFLHDVRPGEEAPVAALLKAPSTPGRYEIKVDLVKEGTAWFEDLGGTPVWRGLEVRAGGEPVFPDSRIPGRLAADIHMRRQEADDAFIVTVRNVGDTIWLAQPLDEPGIPSHGRGYVRLGVQLLGGDGRLLQRDYRRVPLPHDVQPGEEVDLMFRLDPADWPAGCGGLRFDMVDEEICWFESAEYPPVKWWLADKKANRLPT